MKNYVISLMTQTKRREHIQKQFSQQDISFEFFDAITPDKVERLAEQFEIKLNNKEMSPPEYACLLSHISLWHKIVNDNLPYMGIFEDDIYLGEGADLLLKDGSWLPKGFDIVRIEKRNEKVNTSYLANYQYKQFKFYKMLQMEWGAGGYIMSYKGAKFFTDYIKKMKVMGNTDYIIFDILLPFPNEYIQENLSNPRRNMKILQINPAVCIQDCILNFDNTQLVSSLDEIRVQYRRNLPKDSAIKKKIPFRKKIIRELIRPFKQLVNKIRRIYYLSYYRTIELTPLHKKD